MKLHLTKSLRAALLACVCASVANSAWASELTGGESYEVTAGEYTTTGSGQVTLTMITVNAGDVTLEATTEAPIVANLGTFNGSSTTFPASFVTSKLTVGNNVTLTLTDGINMSSGTIEAQTGSVITANNLYMCSDDKTSTLNVNGGSMTAGSAEIRDNKGTISVSNGGNLTVTNTLSVKGNKNTELDLDVTGTNTTMSVGGLSINQTTAIDVTDGATLTFGTLGVSIASDKTATLTVDSTSSLNISSTIVNNGALTLTLDGTLTISDNTALTRTSDDSSVNGYGARFYIVQGAESSTLSLSNSSITVDSASTYAPGVTLTLSDDGKSLYYVDSTYYFINTGTEAYNSTTHATAKTFVITGTVTTENGTDNVSYSTLTFSHGQDFSGDIELNNGIVSFTGSSHDSTSGTITLTGGNNTIKGNGTSINAAIVGTGTLTLSQSESVLYMKNAINNDGDVNISGTVHMMENATFGSAVDSVNIGAGSTLLLNKSGVFAGGSSINLEGESSTSVATLTVNSDQTLTGDTKINLKGNALINGEKTLTYQGLYINASGSNNVINANLAADWNLNMDVAENGVLTLNGAVTQNGSGPFRKTGAGELIISTNSSVDEFNVNVLAGTLTFAAGERTVTAKIDVASGATVTANGTTLSTLNLNGGTLAIAGNASASGAATLAADSKIISTGTSTWNGSVSGTGNLTLSGYGDNGTLTVNNAINNAGTVTIDKHVAFGSNASVGANVTSIVVNGSAANLRLNAYTNVTDTEVSVSDGGTLVVAANPTLSALKLNGGNVNISNNTLSGAITLSGDASVIACDSYLGSTLNASVTGTGDLELTVTPSSSDSANRILHVGGTINNDGGLKVTGAVEFEATASVGSAVDSVSVTSGGTMLLNNGATISSATSVAQGGTLDLTDVTTLSANGVNLAAGSTLIFGNVVEAGPIVYTGSLNIAEGIIIDLSAWCANTETEGKTTFDSYMALFTTGIATLNDLDESTSGAFSHLEGVKVTLIVDGYINENAWLSVSADGNTVSVVPEPTTATLSLLALAGLAMRRRRK